MPTSTQESGQERRRLLRSLQEFSAGAGDAPVVTKWTNASDAVLNSGSDCALKEFHRKDEGSEPENQAITFVLSTDDVDRHGDVITADGWVLDSYRENPVLRTETSGSSGTFNLLTIFVDLDIEAKSVCRLCSRYLRLRIFGYPPEGRGFEPRSRRCLPDHPFRKPGQGWARSPGPADTGTGKPLVHQQRPLACHRNISESMGFSVLGYRKK